MFGLWFALVALCCGWPVWGESVGVSPVAFPFLECGQDVVSGDEV